jgi:hypothetical protein
MEMLSPIMASALLSLGGILFIAFRMLEYSGLWQKYTKNRLKATSGVQKLGQLSQDKFLFYQLHNQETYPEIIVQAQERLIELLDFAIFTAQQNSKSSILDVQEYSPGALRQFLAQREVEIMSEYKAYLKRRKNGGSRELLIDRDYAKYWLRTSAPMRYVDGAWLGGIHTLKTPTKLRQISRIAWQILSEELGDGNLAKNHVYIYSELLRSLNIPMGKGDSNDFIHPKKNINVHGSVWSAAVAQLALAVRSEEFFPEIIGFTLGYETITVQTMVTAFEMRELGMDPTYFNLHITIDNSASGHTAMAKQATIDFLSMIQGENMNQVWRRIQAGFLLCEQTTAEPPKISEIEAKVLKIFSSKIDTANSMHEQCLGLIGGRDGKNLRNWLDPEHWESRKEIFVNALAASRWLQPGKPSKSRLITELNWGGRMFGVFTDKEVDIIQDWIVEMDPPQSSDEMPWNQSYTQLTIRLPSEPSTIAPLHYSSVKLCHPLHTRNQIQLDYQNAEWKLSFAELLLASSIPLQYFLINPTKAATPRGMLVLNILRELYGFSQEVRNVSGMDEVWTPSGLGVVEIALEMRSVTTEEIGKDWRWFDRLARAPRANVNFLLGAQLAFAVCILAIQNNGFSIKDNVTEKMAYHLNRIGLKVRNLIAQAVILKDNELQLGFWTIIAVLKYGQQVLVLGPDLSLQSSHQAWPDRIFSWFANSSSRKAFAT